MPTYTFRNKTTGEINDTIMTIKERGEFLEANPDVEQLITKPNGFIPGHGMKPDDGFRDILRNIKASHPGSTVETF